MPELLPRFHRRELALRDAATVARIIAETGEDVVALTPGAGMHADPIRLRGIPVVGGATGARVETSPLPALLAKEAGESRRRRSQR